MLWSVRLSLWASSHLSTKCYFHKLYSFSVFSLSFLCPLYVFSLSSPSQSGGFYSAEDADSVPASGGTKKREGAFCVWTASEIRRLLSDVVEGAKSAATQADIFMHHYGVKEQGNVDPEQVFECVPVSHVLYSV